MWRLRCEAGRQCWEYDESTPLSEADRQVAAQIEQAQSAFQASRHERRQAADQVFRLQAVQQPTGGASGSALDALFAQHRVEDGDREDDVEAALVRGACAYARLQRHAAVIAARARDAPLPLQHAAPRRRLGPAHRSAVEHVRQRDELCGAAAAGSGGVGNAAGAGARLHPSTWRRVGHPVVGQVLAGVPGVLRVARPEPADAGDVAAAVRQRRCHRRAPSGHRLAGQSGDAGALLVPLPHGVPADERSVRPAGYRAADAAGAVAAPRAVHRRVRPHRLAGASLPLLCSGRVHPSAARAAVAVERAVRVRVDAALAAGLPARSGVAPARPRGDTAAGARRGPQHQARVHRAGEQGDQPAGVLVRPPVARRRGRRSGAPGTHPGLSVAGGGRHEDAGLQRVAAVGHGVCGAGAGRVRRSVDEPGAGGRARPGALLPAHQSGRLAVQHPRPRLAHLRLHRRGTARGAGAAAAVPRRAGGAVAAHSRPPPGRRPQRDVVVSESQRRLGHVREHPQLSVVGVAEPERGVRRYHDRLGSRRVHQCVRALADRVRARVSAARAHGGDAHRSGARPDVHPAGAAGGRQLVRQLGRVFHVRNVVCGGGAGGGRRYGGHLSGAAAGVRVSGGASASVGRGRLGRDLPELQPAALASRARGADGEHRLGADEPAGRRVASAGRGGAAHRAAGGTVAAAGATAEGRVLGAAADQRRVQPELHDHLQLRDGVRAVGVGAVPQRAARCVAAAFVLIRGGDSRELHAEPCHETRTRALSISSSSQHSAFGGIRVRSARHSCSADASGGMAGKSRGNSTGTYSSAGSVSRSSPLPPAAST
eukprot:ctg_28.g35